MMSDLARLVTAGVDTHSEFHVAVVVDGVGRKLGDRSFLACGSGYEDLLDWCRSFGRVERIGIEGSGSWGAGLSRFLTGKGVTVVEVGRVQRVHRRRHGKTDAADAFGAALTALSGSDSGIPKSGAGPVESLRVLLRCQQSVVAAMTATINQLRAVIMTGPDQLRSNCSQHKTQLRLARFLVARRPGPDLHDPNTATAFVAGVLARQWLELHERRTILSAQIEIIVETIAPTLSQLYGVGPITSAQLLVCAGDNPDRLKSAAGFVALCGASPIPASSGKTDRHRLNRSGNRDANSALWRIAMTRMASDPRTRLYVQRRQAEGKTKKEIIRCLKVYIARELFPIIVSALPPQPRSPGWLDPTLHPTTVS